MSKVNPAADRFFTLLQKSGLVDDEQIAAARAARPQADAAGVARYLVEQGALTSWQARKLQAGQHALHLGKYKLLDRLPWGDTGRVYLAEHTQMRSRVAIKTLDRALAEDPEAIKRFQKEGGVAARLDHPHIIHVRDFDCESNYYFLVMEYVEGEGLDQRVGRDGPLPPDKAADLLAQAASGLAHAHEQGVLHRDLQPVKLLLTADGGVKILDLGAADLAYLEADGEPRTNPYAAPEVWKTPDAADARSDLYSLGAIFYFMLNGQAPPAAAEGVKSSARRRRPNLPDELVEICDKLLKTDPDERYADAGEVVDALQAWLEQNRRKAPEPPAARPERPVLKTRDTSASDSNKPAAADFDLSVKKPSAAARVRTGGRPQPRGGAKPSKAPAESTELEVVETPWWKNLKIIIPAALGAVVVCAVFGVALAVIMDDGQPTSTQVAKGDKEAGKDSEKSSKGDPSGKADAAKKPKGGESDFKFPQPSEIAREQTAQEKAKEKAEQEEKDRIARLKAAAAEAVKPKADKPPEKPPEKPAEPAGPPKTPFATVPVEVVRVSAPGGVTLERLVEDPVSYLATGEKPAGARYEIVVKTDAAKITGICLQVLAHELLPKSGPGRGEAGNFQLDHVRLAASDSDVFVSTDEVPLVSAEADVTSLQAPIAGALDSDPAKFWNVGPQIGKNHWAVFRAKQPLERTGTTYLQIILDHGPAAIGRFRVWAVTGEAPADPKTLFANAPVDSPPVWNPLGGLVSQISLPALDGGPETLGDLAQDQAVVAYLLGGGKASPRRSFSMSETSPQNWEIVLHETTAPQGPGVVVAKVTHADGRLAFQWTPAAKEQSEAAWLANCVLQFELGAKSRKIVLRTPIETEALTLNFKSGRALARVEIPQLPDPAGIKFLFDQQAEGFPPHQFDPAPQLAFDAGATVMKVGAEEKLVQLHIKSKGGPRGAELNLTANLALAADAKPVMLNKANLNRVEMSIGGALQQMTGISMQLEQALKQAGGNQGLKKQLETQKATLDQRMLEAQAANQKLEGLKALLATLSGIGGVTYRVVYQVDDQTIELARSLPPTPQEVEQPQGLNLGQ